MLSMEEPACAVHLGERGLKACVSLCEHPLCEFKIMDVDHKGRRSTAFVKAVRK